MIEVKNLNKIYDRRRHNENHVLKDVSLTLPEIGFVCILGPSGCGKTSLLNAIGGLDTFEGGTISTGNFTAKKRTAAGFEAERNKHFGYIFQNYYLLQEHSVGYNVYLGLHSLKLKHKEKLRRVREALQAVEMDRYIRRKVSELSGGQQQRVAIARALARKPRVILADEPTGNLDEANTRNICALLRSISKTSLVLMVTHEQRIARFFADRIISLENGEIRSDESQWERGILNDRDSRTLYAGDYHQQQLHANSIQLRLLQQEGALPVSLSVVVMKDQIVIKTDDPRITICGTNREQPLLLEENRPELTLEQIDEKAIAPAQEAPARSRPGCGIRFRDMLAEARHMSSLKGLKNIGTRLFLMLLTVLTALGIGDYLKLKSINPEDFIQTHSQVLRVVLERGTNADQTVVGLPFLSHEFKSHLAETDLEYYYVPAINNRASVSGNAFAQAGHLSVELSHFTYVPIAYLEESQLLMGRMPQTAEEVVIDRWVLDAALKADTVANNGVSSFSYFLGKQLTLENQTLSPTIVGICDSGEPAVYMLDDLFASVGTVGTYVASLSALQAKYPGKYDDVVLAEDECIVLPHNAGSGYRDKLGANYNTKANRAYKIVMSIEETDFYPRIVVADSQIDDIMLSISYQQFWIFCQDKAAMSSHLHHIADEMNGSVVLKIMDSYVAKMEEYTEASRMRADARRIITFTIIAMSMVMLYLLRRSQVYERIGMLAVYRLLGVPPRKAMGIFAIESLLTTLTAVLPSAAAVWIIIHALKEKVQVLLPWKTALWVYAGVAAFHLIVSILPMLRLLRLPPARLAAKYDF